MVPFLLEALSGFLRHVSGFVGRSRTSRDRKPGEVCLGPHDGELTRDVQAVSAAST
jgi:hypothetical protein